MRLGEIKDMINDLGYNILLYVSLLRSYILLIIAIKLLKYADHTTYL